MATLKGMEQAAREANWLVMNFAKEKDPERKAKWLKKWRNWQESHPEETRIIDGILIKVLGKKLGVDLGSLTEIDFNNISKAMIGKTIKMEI